MTTVTDITILILVKQVSLKSVLV